MWLLPVSIIVFTIVIAVPLSRYMATIMNGNYKAPRLLGWFEKRLDSGPQNWKQYTVALLIFNTVLFVYGYIVLSLQPLMPLNPRGLGMLAPSTIFNTVISFITNTNIQHYSGDVAFSNFSQMFFCIAMFFLSAAVGLCALTAIIRALRSDAHLGNFFVDMWRVGRHARTRDNGHNRQRATEAADHCRRSPCSFRTHEDDGHQRRWLLWHELGPSV